MATKQEQGAFDFGDTESKNIKHQAEISKQMFKDVTDKKMTMDEFAEKAKSLNVGKPKTGGSGGGGGTPSIKGSKPGGSLLNMAKGGTASSRADGCAIRGKTKGTMVMCGGGMSYGKKK
jgi:hypothetical protein